MLPDFGGWVKSSGGTGDLIADASPAGERVILYDIRQVKTVQTRETGNSSDMDAISFHGEARF